MCDDMRRGRGGSLGRQAGQKKLPSRAVSELLLKNVMGGDREKKGRKFMELLMGTF